MIVDPNPDILVFKPSIQPQIKQNDSVWLKF